MVLSALYLASTNSLITILAIEPYKGNYPGYKGNYKNNGELKYVLSECECRNFSLLFPDTWAAVYTTEVA